METAGNNKQAESDTQRLLTKPIAEVSFLYLCALCLYCFAYALAISTMGVVVLPIEAHRLFPNKSHAAWLGVMFGCAGVSQLVCPAIGYLSDRCTSRVGKRKFYMLLGYLITMFGLSIMFASRSFGSSGPQTIHRIGYVASLFVAVLGLNVTYSAFTALVPDFVPASQTGLASGVFGLCNFLGTLFGYLIVGSADVSLAYWLYIFTITICLAISCLAAWNERILVTEVEAEAESEGERQFDVVRPVVWGELVSCFKLKPQSHGCFFWVFLLRTFFYLGISAQAFLQYYFRDVTQVKNPQQYVALIVIVAQFSAAIVCVPSGRIADRHGRKGLIFISCVTMMLSYAAFLLRPTESLCFAVAVFYGVGNGVFISVDYALAVDTLPNKDDVAKDLGLWGVAAFLGCLLGPFLTGPLMVAVGSTADGEHYTFGAYVLLLFVSGAFFLVGITFLFKIKTGEWWSTKPIGQVKETELAVVENTTNNHNVDVVEL